MAKQPAKKATTKAKAQPAKKAPAVPTAAKILATNGGVNDPTTLG